MQYLEFDNIVRKPWYLRLKTWIMIQFWKNRYSKHPEMITNLSTEEFLGLPRAKSKKLVGTIVLQDTHHLKQYHNVYREE